MKNSFIHMLCKYRKIKVEELINHRCEILFYILFLIFYCLDQCSACDVGDLSKGHWGDVGYSYCTIPGDPDPDSPWPPPDFLGDYPIDSKYRRFTGSAYRIEGDTKLISIVELPENLFYLPDSYPEPESHECITGFAKEFARYYAQSLKIMCETGVIYGCLSISLDGTLVTYVHAEGTVYKRVKEKYFKTQKWICDINNDFNAGLPETCQ